LVAGEKEQAAGTVDIRTRENKRIGTMRVDELHEYFMTLMPPRSGAYGKFYAEAWDSAKFQAGAGTNAA